MNKHSIIMPAQRPSATPYQDPFRWVLDEPYACQLDGSTLHIPAGYEFDIASVPRPLFPFVNRDELGLTGPLVHDWIYQAHSPPGTRPPRRFKRREADRYLLLICKHEKVPCWRRSLAWAAVRLFGWWAWRT